MAATLRPDEVRARLAAALEGLTVLAGTLREAPCSFDAFPAEVPQARRHLAFAVSLSRTSEAPEQRQRQGRPLRVSHDVAVRLLHRQRKTDTVADIDAAMRAEAAVVVAVLGASSSDGLQVTYAGTSARRDAGSPEDAYLIQLEFTAAHHIPTV